MNKKTVRLLSVLLCGLVITGCFAGCQSAETIAPKENSYNPVYSMSTHEQSPDVVIDGVLDEAAWQNKSWFVNTYANNDGSKPVLEVTAFPTEQGVYIGSKITDRNLTSDGQRHPAVNSNWELYLAACNAGESLSDLENRGSWNTHRIYVDMRGESMSLYTNTERAVTVDGELNSGATNGATLELFVAWDTLGVDTSKGIPETFGLLPFFRAVLITGSETAYMAPAGANLNAPETYHVFDKNGYTRANAEGAVLGNANNGYSKSGGWDLSQIDQGIVENTHSGQGFLYFTGEQAENFIVEATLIPVGAVNDDWPKAGICFQQTDGLWHSIMVDPNGEAGLVDGVNGTKNFPTYQLVTLDLHDGNWNQKSLSGYDKTNPNATKQEGVKLTVVKYGNRFWYFCDGKYMLSETVSWITGECFPGLFTLGFDVIYKDYSCREITTEDLKAYLNKSELYLVNASVDGKGGSVSADTQTITNGDSYSLSITTDNGYQLTSVLLNGKEIIEAVRAKAKDGVYTVTGAQGNQDIVLTFEKADSVIYDITVTDGTQPLTADIILINKNDGSAYYVGRAAGKRGFQIKLPAGTYELRVKTDDGDWQSKTVEITGDMEDEFLYTVTTEDTAS